MANQTPVTPSNQTPSGAPELSPKIAASPLRHDANIDAQTSNRAVSSDANISPEEKKRLELWKQERRAQEERQDYIREYGEGDNSSADADRLAMRNRPEKENSAANRHRRNAQQLRNEARRREEELKKRLQQNNDPSLGKLSRIGDAEKRAMLIEDLRREGKEGGIFRKIYNEARIVHIRAQGLVHSATEAVTKPVTGLFKSGTGVAKDAKLAEGAIHTAEMAKEGIKGLKAVKMLARGSQVFAAATAWTGLGGVAGVAVDATLGLVAGGLVYMATGNAKAAALEAVDTASPVPVKAGISLIKAGGSAAKGDGKGAWTHIKQAGANALSWTGLGIFTGVNNVIHRLEQGKEIVEHRKGIEEAAKVAGKGIKEVVAHPTQVAHALDYAAHHAGETAKIAAEVTGAAGVTVLGVAAVKHAEHKGIVDKNVAHNVAAKGYDTLKVKLHEEKEKHDNPADSAARREKHREEEAKAEALAHKIVADAKGGKFANRTGIKGMVPDTLPAPKVAKVEEEIKDRLHISPHAPVEM